MFVAAGAPAGRQAGSLSGWRQSLYLGNRRGSDGLDNSNRVNRNKAGQLVNDIFSMFLEDTAAERSDEQTRALTEADQTGNIGSYLPTLTDVVCGQLGRSIGILAKTYVKEIHALRHTLLIGDSTRS